jgi:hypothetical protein
MPSWKNSEAIRREWAPWESNDKAKEALATAVVTLLDMVPPPDDGEPGDFGEDDPKTVGRMVARRLFHEQQRPATELENIEYERSFTLGEPQDRKPPKKKRSRRNDPGLAR